MYIKISKQTYLKSSRERKALIQQLSIYQPNGTEFKVSLEVLQNQKQEIKHGAHQ